MTQLLTIPELLAAHPRDAMFIVTRTDLQALLDRAEAAERVWPPEIQGEGVDAEPSTKVPDDVLAQRVVADLHAAWLDAGKVQLAQAVIDRTAKLAAAEANTALQSHRRRLAEDNQIRLVCPTCGFSMHPGEFCQVCMNRTLQRHA